MPALHERNEARATWAESALENFTYETYGGRSFAALVREQPDEGDDAYTAVQDLIGDLLHVAVRYGWDPDELVRRAVAGFDHENAPDYQGD